jgi:hypothetical protein
MPPKAKQPANGTKTDAKPKAAASSSSAAATTSAAADTNKATTAGETSGKATTATKPDATAYHAEQEALKKQIDECQAKLVSTIHLSFTSSILSFRSSNLLRL